jgi:hypothetical protein
MTSRPAAIPFLIGRMLLGQTAEQFQVEHQRVLDEMNVKGAKGEPMELDDPRIPALLRKGWDLAGAWAAAYLDAHPTLRIIPFPYA